MTYGHQNLDKYLLAMTKHPHQMGLPLPHGCEHSTLPARQPRSTKTHFTVLRNKCSSTGHQSTKQGAPVTHAAACQRLKRCCSHISSEHPHTAALCCSHAPPGNSPALSHVQLVVRVWHMRTHQLITTTPHSLQPACSCSLTAIPTKRQVATDTRDVYDQAAGTWAVESSTCFSS